VTNLLIRNAMLNAVQTRHETIVKDGKLTDGKNRRRKKKNREWKTSNKKQILRCSNLMRDC